MKNPDDALLDPDVPPRPGVDGEYFNMWENDGFEHLNQSIPDGGFIVYEVPDGILMIGTTKKKCMKVKQFLYMVEKVLYLDLMNLKLLMKKMKKAISMQTF